MQLRHACFLDNSKLFIYMVSKGTEKHTDFTAHLSASTSLFGEAGHTGLDSLQRHYSESEIITNISVRLILPEREEIGFLSLRNQVPWSKNALHSCSNREVSSS